MAYLNKVMLIGRVTAEPSEPRSLPNGGSVASFRFAVGRSKKGADGSWENDPNPLYIDCEAFGRPDEKRNLANIVSQYFKKGDQVYLEGRLQLDQWEDKNGGGTRSKHKVIVSNIEFLGGGAAVSEDAPQQDSKAAPSKPAGRAVKGGGRRPAGPTSDGGGFTVDDDTSIPF